MKPAAVELSVLIGVGGCGWPSAMRMYWIGIAICALWKTQVLQQQQGRNSEEVKHGADTRKQHASPSQVEEKATLDKLIEVQAM